MDGYEYYVPVNSSKYKFPSKLLAFILSIVLGLLIAFSYGWIGYRFMDAFYQYPNFPPVWMTNVVLCGVPILFLASSIALHNGFLSPENFNQLFFWTLRRVKRRSNG